MLGVTILAVQDYSSVVAEYGFGLAFAEALICSAGAGVGFLVAMLLFCGVRSRVENLSLIHIWLPEATSPPFQPIKPEAKASSETLEPMPVVWVEPSIEMAEIAPSVSKAT